MMAIKPSLNFCCLDPHTERTQDGENRILSLDRCTLKESVQWAQLLHLPIHRKALGALGCLLFFFPLTVIFRCSNYVSFCYKTPIYPGSSYLFAAVLQSYLRGFLRPLAFLLAQTVKNLPAMWDPWVQSLDWEDPLEESKANHSSILVWRIPMDRGAWRATVHGVAKSQTWLSD